MKSPCLRYRLATIRELLLNASQGLVSTTTSAELKLWSPLLSEQIPQPVLSIVREVTLSACVKSVTAAQMLAELGFRSLLIHRPVVDTGSLEVLRMVAGICDVQVTIDHFRHAELLSQTLAGHNLNVGVMLDVDTGHSLSGVRPGPDSIRLATAVSQLPGLKLNGVIVDETTCSGSHEITHHTLEQAVAVAKHCQRMILAAGFECENIATGFSNRCSAASMPDVTRVLTNPFGIEQFPDATQNVKTSSAALGLVGQVISRPSLEWCVVNIGAGLIKQAFQAGTINPSGAKLLKSHRDIASLQLSGASLDLRIGDEVEFALRCVPEEFLLPSVVIN